MDNIILKRNFVTFPTIIINRKKIKCDIETPVDTYFSSLDISGDPTLVYNTPGVKTTFEILQKFDDIKVIFEGMQKSENQEEKCRISGRKLCP